jgi:hypothetical protein
MSGHAFGSMIHDLLGSGTPAGWAAKLLLAVAIVAGSFLLAHFLRLGFKRLRKRYGPGARPIYIVEQIGGYICAVKI